MNIILDRKLSRDDPRIPFLAILLVYLVLGITLLGFNKSPQQILVTIAFACVLDMLLHALFKNGRVLLPLSAAITGASLSILVNYAHGAWYTLIPVFFAIASKYLITANGRHVFNPSLFGIVIALVVSDGMISASPAYQWGGTVSVAAFIVTAALVLFVFRIQRTALIVSFLGFYTASLALRAWLVRWHIPPETIILGTLTSPAFYLFTFFMITDPATSPRSTRGQVLMAFIITVTDLALHKMQAYSTLFYAGFIYFSLRYAWLQIPFFKTSFTVNAGRVRVALQRTAVILLMGSAGLAGYRVIAMPHEAAPRGISFTRIDATEAGLHSEKGDILERVDPRIRHIAKWLLSVGDAVAISDINGDGLPDMFLTYPLKDAAYRAALYLNKGGFRFDRVRLPALESLNQHPEHEGLPSGALWFDYDGDGDDDLLVVVSFGKPRLLRNLWVESGAIGFEDVSDSVGLADYVIGVSANAADLDKDGDLDLLIGNTMSTVLSGYDTRVMLNLFSLPAPEFPGDRRMFNFMHRTWNNADNGGENYIYLNSGSAFVKQDADSMGLADHRWTLDIGTGDLNNDGLTDLYMANDFGPDAMFINEGNLHFRNVHGRLSGSLGRDTYKGMNATLSDVDNNGFLDIYVSNVHEKLQAEGSMLWMNRGDIASPDADTFSDEAAHLNILNEKRFGWGAAAGDLNLDGMLDIVQANGMVDDAYDSQDNGCPDYWYWNEKIALTGPDVHGYADEWADLRGRCIFPHERNRVYINQGSSFIDVAAQTGLDQLDNARGVALADMDNDGDLDIIMTHQFDDVSMFRNDSSAKAWLGLGLKGNGEQCNTDAIGTRVVLHGIDGAMQYREVQASNGFSAQSDSRILYGGVNNDHNYTVDIYWCGSEHPEQYSLSTGSYHHIQQPKHTTTQDQKTI